MSQDKQTYCIYMTSGSREAALEIGRRLVESRLVACVNVLCGATSVYWWNDVLQEEEEAVLFAKTTADRVQAVISRVRELHSYECPCVVAWPIAAGNAAYFDWVRGETRDA